MKTKNQLSWTHIRFSQFFFHFFFFKWKGVAKCILFSLSILSSKNTFLVSVTLNDYYCHFCPIPFSNKSKNIVMYCSLRSLGKYNFLFYNFHTKQLVKHFILQFSICYWNWELNPLHPLQLSGPRTITSLHP